MAAVQRKQTFYFPSPTKDSFVNLGNELFHCPCSRYYFSFLEWLRACFFTGSQNCLGSVLPEVGKMLALQEAQNVAQVMWLQTQSLLFRVR